MKFITGLLLYFILPYTQSLDEKNIETKKWTAKWIKAPKNLIPETLEKLSKIDQEKFKSHPGLKPALYFRKHVHSENVSEATLYCTARGAFKIYLSAKFPLIHRAPSWIPGWTDYNKTIQYYSYNIFGQPQNINNMTIGMIVGPGRYSGYIGEEYNLYGDDMSALVELHMKFSNGSSTIIHSDETWKVNTGEILFSDLMYGELYYENLILRNWSLNDYDDTNWPAVITENIEENIKFVEDTLPVIRYFNHYARKYWEVNPGTWIYSFDELIYGAVAFHLTEFSFNARIRFRLGESLYSNGSLYTAKNGITSVANTFVLNDPDNRPRYLPLAPVFSVNSFRYVEITGYPAGLFPGTVRSYRYAQIKIDETLTTSNKLISNIFRYLRSSTLANMNSIPTSAPFGENRVGWLEPAGLFSSTAFNLFDGRLFYRKWLNDIRNSQVPSGAYSNMAPNIHALGDASPGSGFAPIIITYNLYKYYEDIHAVEQNYIPNQNWLKFVISNNPDFLYFNNISDKYSDYANINAETPKEVISTAYFAFSSLLMSRMSKILQKSADQEYYDALHKNISRAFVRAYVNSTDGQIKSDTQTAYVLALVSRVLHADLIPKAVQKLVNNIKAKDYHLTTGYVGTSFILPVLAEYGHSDIAYKILLQERYPSWGYMFQNPNRSGLWERWNSWTERDGFQGSSLNSIGLGTVGNFLYQYIAGINSDDEQLSFKKVIIKPYVGGGINSFKGQIKTNYGPISSSWSINGNIFNIKIFLPQNTTGKLILPFASQTWIRELTSGRQQFQFPLKTNET